MNNTVCSLEEKNNLKLFTDDPMEKLSCSIGQVGSEVPVSLQLLVVVVVINLVIVTSLTVHVALEGLVHVVCACNK